MNIPQTPSDYSLPDVFPITDPAAGANWTQTVPANTIWLIHTINFRLVTSATAATREAGIQINDGTSLTTIGLAGQTQIASLTRDYTFLHGNHGNAVGSQIAGNIPPRLFLQPGWTLTSSVINLQAGDQLSIITLTIQQWLTTVT